MSNEVIMNLLVPAFVALLVFYLQEKATYKRQQTHDTAVKERAITLIEGDLGTLKSTTDRMSVVLDRIDSRMDEFSERITRVETKVS